MEVPERVLESFPEPTRAEVMDTPGQLRWDAGRNHRCEDRRK